MKFLLIIFLAGFGSSHCYKKISKQEDNHSNLDRPCDLEDLHCIRKFLAANSGCRIKTSGPPETLFVSRMLTCMPAINATLLYRNSVLNGFKSAKIVEFGKSKTTGNLVLAIRVKNMYGEVEKATLTLLRRAKESISLTDCVTFKYPSLTLTAIIPRVPHLSLEAADIHAFTDSKTIKFTAGPKITEDKMVKKHISLFTDNMAILSQERMTNQAPPLMKTLIQEYLCDFGDKTFNYYIAK